jgi:mono/diheme cytochrome c family protein
MAQGTTPALAILAVMLGTVGVAAGQQVDNDGAALYGRYCASCHGPRGEGDGPVAAAMLVTVPNLRALSARAAGEFPRDAVMQYIDGRNLPAAHGDRLMPVWGGTFAEATDDDPSGNELARRRIAAITAFIEQLQNWRAYFSDSATRTSSASERTPIFCMTRARCSSTVR